MNEKAALNFIEENIELAYGTGNSGLHRKSFSFFIFLVKLFYKKLVIDMENLHK